MAIFATQSPDAGETGLGWSTSQSAAQTRSLLSSILSSLTANDKLVFRGKYNYAGNLSISRSDLTIEGGGGANKGLHVTDPTATGNLDWLEFTGNRVKFRDFTVTADPGFNQNKPLFGVEGDDFLFEWGKIDCDFSTFFELRGADRAIIRRNEFSNVSGFNAGRSVNSFATGCVRIQGGGHNGVYEFNYAHHFPHEHFKTISVGIAPTGWRIDDNFVTDVNRDLLDTTGGFRGSSPSNRASISRNTLKRVNQSLIDAKFSGKDANNYPARDRNTKWLQIDDNDLWNCNDFITVSLNTQRQFLTTTTGDYYWRDAIPEDFLCVGNKFQSLGGLILLKHGLNLQLVNSQKYGSVGGVDLFSQDDMEVQVTDNIAAAIYAAGTGSPGFYSETGSTTAAARAATSDTPSFSYGPRSGTAEPSSDPLYVLSGSSFRTNTDLGASSADIMFGVHNANGADSDTATITVS
jgi:hypothetical protein